MNFLILFLSAFLDVTQTVLTKKSSIRTDVKFMLSFNVFKSIGALVLLLLLLGINFSVNLPTVILGTVYGLLLLSSMCTSFMALNCGNMALTAIIISYSVIIPFLFGGIFLHEAIDFLQITGLFMMLLSILLMNFRKSGEGFGVKWLVFTFSCFITNGLCSVVQKLHQTAYPGQYCKEFMTVAFGVITLILLTVLFIKYKGVETKTSKTAFTSGMCTGSAYLLTLYLSSVFNATVLFPIIAVCGAVLNCFASRMFFKDKLRKIQLIAIAIGVISVLFIS